MEEKAGNQDFVFFPHFYFLSFILMKMFSALATFKVNSARALNLDQSKNLLISRDWTLTCLQYKPFENSVEKGEIAHYEQFHFFPQHFLPF